MVTSCTDGMRQAGAADPALSTMRSGGAPRNYATRDAFLLYMADLTSLLGAQRGTDDASSHEIHADDGKWAASLRVAESYNAEKPSTWDAEPNPLAAPRVSLAVSTDLKQWNYRYMFEKKGERSLGTWYAYAELDNRLDDMGEVIRQSFALPTELEDPSIPSQDSIYSVGRICARIDPQSKQAGASDRLTQADLMLETSRMVGNGQRVPLALDPSCQVRYAWADSAAQSASVVGLFPGMIVGVKGRNGSGNRFVAEELLMVRLLA